jgi:hypothetical protein
MPLPFPDPFDDDPVVEAPTTRYATLPTVMVLLLLVVVVGVDVVQLFARYSILGPMM